ncbi:MAG: GNAT family N-acetyltransferase [Rhizobiales bacterium]|nr:GNAT family N-acetyltransferase [Hyphomicrobiales bacterium]
MAGEVTVARVTAADRADWERLWQAWQDYMEGAVPMAVTAASWRLMMCDDGGLTALIARMAVGTAVGFANVSSTPFAWTGGPVLFLQDLFVQEEARGAGVGEALLRGVYDLADEIGASQVFWMVDEDNARLQAFYARHGIRTPYLRYMRRPWPW